MDQDPSPMTPGGPGSGPDRDAVLAANVAFYAAFEAQDLDAMSAVWAHNDDVACTHPGWPTLHGWGAVVGSWVALFGADVPLQFIVTDERAHVVGDMAWVTASENLIDQSAGGVGGGTVAAVNVFRRDGDRGRWLMVLHHGSPVSASAPLL